jgi:poly(3-hydroxybutyrate) depolymerase
VPEAQWNDGSRRALVLPPDPTNEQTPILCFLHGVGQSADNRRPQDPGAVPQDLGVVCRHQSPPARWQAGDPCFTRFIIVCPQLERRRPWTAQDASAVRVLIANVQREYGGSQGRKLLTGFSNGGAGVFVFAEESVAAQVPQFWTALWAVAPPPPGGFPPAPSRNWPLTLHYGAPDNMVTQPMPVGSRPPWLPLNTPDRIYEVLLRGVAPSGDGHRLTCIASYGDAVAHNWLRRVTP